MANSNHFTLGKSIYLFTYRKYNKEKYYTAIQNCNNAGNSTEFIKFMLKMINDTIYEMNNSKEMKDKSMLLLFENEQKVVECINKNVIIGAKNIIEQTKIADRTVRRILKKFVDNKTLVSVGNTDKTPINLFFLFINN